MSSATVNNSGFPARRSHFQGGSRFVQSTVSIPSKFQTLVTDNAEKKGFCSGTKRFSDLQDMTEVPGPGRYQQLSSMVSESASFSKKGFGGFVSSSKRFPTRRKGRKSVGPGDYDPFVKKEHYFNRSACTSNFHLPIALQRDPSQLKNQTPAPNQYSIPYKITGMPAHDLFGAASAVFRSRSKRDVVIGIGTNKTPAPGAYNVKENLVYGSPKGTCAPFKSRTERHFMVHPPNHPGPGTYHPFEAVDMPNLKRLPRKHYLGISAPAAPLPPSPPQPGPGHYNLVDYDGAPKFFVSSSMFVSNTSRWKGEVGGEVMRHPGPGTYNPRSSGKQSFLFNRDKKWI